IQEAEAGRGRTLFVTGEAGIGKSRLAREAGRLAEDRGLPVRWGRCVEGAQNPYRSLTEALLAATRHTGLPDSPDLVPFRAILGRLLPAWRENASAAVEATPVMLGEGILRLLRALAGSTGSLLVFEDLHWADADTLAVLEYLTDNLAAEPIVLMASIRSD